MDYIALDTDVASNLIKRHLPPALLAKLARYAPCVTFVTLGELTEWAIVRGWGRRNIAVLDRWLATVPVLGYDEDVARRWGRLSAHARRAGRPRPVNDMWNAACCLAENLPLATLNVKDYQDFAEHGLKIVTSD